ncbi:hypothetical protein ScPMuIL_003102 [Solemya velum]
MSRTDLLIALSLGLLCLVISGTRGDSVECYNCIGCDEVKSDTPKTTCSSGYCFKVIVKDTVSRTCGLAEFGNKCEEKDEGEVCGCSSDLCNGQNKIPVNTLIYVISLLVVAVFASFNY